MDNTSVAGSMLWSADGKMLYVHGKPIVLSRFQRMVQDIVTEAEGILWNELMQWTKRFTIELDKVVDNISSTGRGISFVSQNKGLDDGLRPMLEWARTSGLQSPNHDWRKPQVRKYLQRVEAFLELLLFLMHTTGGQPMRGAEVMTLYRRNGIPRSRSLFIMDGEVAFMIDYDKPNWPKVVPRFLPASVGQLLAVYLVYIRPFTDNLNFYLTLANATDYLWADAHGPWRSERLARVIVRETGKRLGTELDVHMYRDMAVCIGRKMIGDEFAPRCQYDNISDEDED
jgi:hypothetical protein